MMLSWPFGDDKLHPTPHYKSAICAGYLATSENARAAVKRAKSTVWRVWRHRWLLASKNMDPKMEIGPQVMAIQWVWWTIKVGGYVAAPPGCMRDSFCNDVHVYLGLNSTTKNREIARRKTPMDWLIYSILLPIVSSLFFQWFSKAHQLT